MKKKSKAGRPKGSKNGKAQDILNKKELIAYYHGYLDGMEKIMLYLRRIL